MTAGKKRKVAPYPGGAVKRVSRRRTAAKPGRASTTLYRAFEAGGSMWRSSLQRNVPECWEAVGLKYGWAVKQEAEAYAKANGGIWPIRMDVGGEFPHGVRILIDSVPVAFDHPERDA